MAEAAEFIPACVSQIAAYWRKRRPLPAGSGPSPSGAQAQQDRSERPMPVRLGTKIQGLLWSPPLKLLWHPILHQSCASKKPSDFSLMALMQNSFSHGLERIFALRHAAGVFRQRT